MVTAKPRPKQDDTRIRLITKPGILCTVLIEPDVRPWYSRLLRPRRAEHDLRLVPGTVRISQFKVANWPYSVGIVCPRFVLGPYVLLNAFSCQQQGAVHTLQCQMVTHLNGTPIGCADAIADQLVEDQHADR